jgi:hypothetical protein
MRICTRCVRCFFGLLWRVKLPALVLNLEMPLDVSCPCNKHLLHAYDVMLNRLAIYRECRLYHIHLVSPMMDL